MRAIETKPCKTCGAPCPKLHTPNGSPYWRKLCGNCRDPRRGKDHWHWRGGERTITKTGYVRVYVKPGVRDLEHRVVWRAAYGPIPHGMHLHHINGDKTDNRLGNLRLIENLEHQALHIRQRDAQRAGRWSIAHNSCVVCGTTEQPHKARGMCSPCYNRSYNIWH